MLGYVKYPPHSDWQSRGDAISGVKEKITMCWRKKATLILGLFLYFFFISFQYDIQNNMLYAIKLKTTIAINNTEFT
jgi:hypothetical protein